jgi:Transposase IS4
MLLEMKDLGIQVCGTIKTNRANLPVHDRMVQSGKKAESRGVMLAYEGTLGTLSDGKKIYFTEWMDSKLVHMLSSYSTLEDTCVRRTKPDVAMSTQLTLPRPSVIGGYNQGMGGTDAMDQKLSYYRPKLRYRKWPKKLIFHIIWLAIMNSHILYKETLGIKRGDPNYELQEYMTTLCCEMTDTPVTKPHIPHRRASCIPLCKKQTNDIDPRRVCSMCHKPKVGWFCDLHKVAVCFRTPDDPDSMCWLNHVNL